MAITRAASALRAVDLRCGYGDVDVVTGACVDVRPGEVTALRLAPGRLILMLNYVLARPAAVCPRHTLRDLAICCRLRLPAKQPRRALTKALTRHHSRKGKGEGTRRGRSGGISCSFWRSV